MKIKYQINFVMVWYKSASLKIPKNIELIFIHLYTPEMNPISKFGKKSENGDLKMKYFRPLKRLLTDFVIPFLPYLLIL